MKKQAFSEITELEVGRVFWESYSTETKTLIISLLQARQSLREIERKVLQFVPAALPAWKRKEIAGRYYMAALYAKKNNLHLN